MFERNELLKRSRTRSKSCETSPETNSPQYTKRKIHDTYNTKGIRPRDLEKQFDDTELSWLIPKEIDIEKDKREMLQRIQEKKNYKQVKRNRRLTLLVEKQICEYCGEHACIPHSVCDFCSNSPSYHHGRCCPYGPRNRECHICKRPA